MASSIAARSRSNPGIHLMVNTTLFSPRAALLVWLPKADRRSLPPGTVNWMKPLNAKPAGFHWTAVIWLTCSRYSPLPTLERTKKPFRVMVTYWPSKRTWPLWPLTSTMRLPLGTPPNLTRRNPSWMTQQEWIAQREEVRRNIGQGFQDATLDNYLSGAQNLQFHAALYGVPGGAVEPRMRQVPDMVGLWDRRDSLSSAAYPAGQAMSARRGAGADPGRAQAR